MTSFLRSSPAQVVRANVFLFFYCFYFSSSQGPELDPEDENEKLREMARREGLIREWERAGQLGREQMAALYRGSNLGTRIQDAVAQQRYVPDEKRTGSHSFQSDTF